MLARRGPYLTHVEQAERDAQGRWSRGSGNPAGRPRGSKNRTPRRRTADRERAAEWTEHDWSVFYQRTFQETEGGLAEKHGAAYAGCIALWLLLSSPSQRCGLCAHCGKPPLTAEAPPSRRSLRSRGSGPSAKAGLSHNVPNLRGCEAARSTLAFCCPSGPEQQPKRNAIVAHSVEPVLPLSSDCLEARDHRDGRRPLGLSFGNSMSQRANV